MTEVTRMNAAQASVNSKCNRTKKAETRAAGAILICSWRLCFTSLRNPPPLGRVIHDASSQVDCVRSFMKKRIRRD
jgi:hypothetical protein